MITIRKQKGFILELPEIYLSSFLIGGEYDAKHLDKWPTGEISMDILNEILRILEFMGKAFIHILPFFALSVFIAAGVNLLNIKDRITNFLRNKIVYSVVIATLFGALSPLCSCGVIPALIALLQIGVPLAPVMSFWIASPLMSPEAFLITWGNLGLELAVARLVAAILMGLISGFITMKLFPVDTPPSSWLRISLSPIGGECSCKTESMSQSLSNYQARSLKLKKFFKDLNKISLFMGGWLGAAFFLEALIYFYFPTHMIKSLFGSQNSFSILWAAVVGIPLYINNISAVPIVSALLSAGMGKGAALAFLLAGPVTSIPAMAAIYGLVKQKIFFTFLFLGFSLSVLLGYFYEFVLRILPMSTAW